METQWLQRYEREYEKCVLRLEEKEKEVHEMQKELHEMQKEFAGFKNYIQETYQCSLFVFLSRNATTDVERETQRRVDEAQRRVDEAQRRVDEAQKRVDGAQNDVREAQRRVDDIPLKKRGRIDDLPPSFSTQSLLSMFQKTYLDDSLKSRFYLFIEKSIQRWMKKKVPYPYFPLIQSSGYGKSRLLSELSQYDTLCMVSICLRSDLHGYPPASEYAISFFKELLRKIHARKVINEEKIEKEYEKEIEEIYHWILSLFYEKICGCGVGNMKDYEIRNFLKSQKQYLIFSIDEARYIFGSETPNEYSLMFRILRHALLQFGDIPFMCILTDTSSGITNYLRAAPYYDSDRTSAFKKYIMPYTQIHTLDVMRFVDEVDEVQIPAFWKFGRPVWYGLRKIAESLDDMWWTVESKLFGKAFNPGDQTHIAAMIGVLTGIRFQYAHSLGTTLVRSHMATLIGVHENRILRDIMYVPEPMLAHIALVNFVSNINSVLKIVDDQFLSELVLEGNRGEFAACLIFLYVRALSHKIFDSATESIQSLSLHEWSKQFGIPQTDTRFHDGFVNYTSFHILDRDLNIFQMDARKVLKWAYEHGLAFQFPRYWKAADLMIPICYEDDYGCILIQIKNSKTKVKVSFTIHDVFSKFKKSPVHDSWRALTNICMTMQLRIEKDDDNYENLCFYGLPKCIDNEIPVKTQFERLLTPWISVEQDDMKRSRLGYLNVHYDYEQNTIISIE